MIPHCSWDPEGRRFARFVPGLLRSLASQVEAPRPQLGLERGGGGGGPASWLSDCPSPPASAGSSQPASASLLLSLAEDALGGEDVERRSRGKAATPTAATHPFRLPLAKPSPSMTSPGGRATARRETHQQAGQRERSPEPSAEPSLPPDRNLVAAVATRLLRAAAGSREEERGWEEGRGIVCW